MLQKAFGPYELQQRLAVGGMAEVYVAAASGTSGLKKRVALKLVHPRYSTDPAFVNMLVEEAKLSVRLSHQNIVQTFDLGRHDGLYFIVMEYIDGCDAHHLFHTLRRRGTPLPVDLAVYVAREVALGLDYAHRRVDEFGQPLHIVHRDISPQNILLSRAGEVKIADFGIAKASHLSEDTDAGVIKGKYFYMSPEQAWGDALDGRSDVFSLGTVLWELLTGERVYPQKDLESLLRAVRGANIGAPSRHRIDVSEFLDDVVARCLATKREDRFATAAELAAALSQFLVRCPVACRDMDLARWVDSVGRPPMPPPLPSSSGPIPITRVQSTEVDRVSSDVDARRSDATEFRLPTGSVLFHTVDERGTTAQTKAEFDAREHVSTLADRPTVPHKAPSSEALEVDNAGNMDPIWIVVIVCILVGAAAAALLWFE